MKPGMRRIICLSHFEKFTWRKGYFHSKQLLAADKVQNREVTVLTPWQYFQRYLDDDFFKSGAEFSAQYYHQKTGKVLRVFSEEIKKNFEMHAVMKFPRIHMYWNAKFLLPLVADAMPTQ